MSILLEWIFTREWAECQIYHMGSVGADPSNYSGTNEGCWSSWSIEDRAEEQNYNLILQNVLCKWSCWARKETHIAWRILVALWSHWSFILICPLSSFLSHTLWVQIKEADSLIKWLLEHLFAGKKGPLRHLQPIHAGQQQLQITSQCPAAVHAIHPPLYNYYQRTRERMPRNHVRIIDIWSNLMNNGAKQKGKM